MNEAEITWISEALAVLIHELQLAEHGGLAGIRAQGLLSSALARPRHLYAFTEPKPDLSALAAAYAFGISRNHPFFDGNKRTAQVVYRTFLSLNGLELVASTDAKYSMMIQLASGTLSEAEFAQWIRQNIKPV
jgi:death-on-curing protein